MEPRDGVEPYSNHAVVAAPLGFTVPLSVADEVVIFVAAFVVTAGIAEVGGGGGGGTGGGGTGGGGTGGGGGVTALT